MWKIEMGTGFLILCVLAVMDWRKRQLPIAVLSVLTIAVFIYRMVIPPENMWLSVAGLLAGGAFAGISFVTEEAFGYGDSWVIAITGMYIGIRKLLALLGTAFLLAGILSAVYLIRHRGGGKQTFPFLPVLAASYLGVMFW